jgi:hypothetical protein
MTHRTISTALATATCALLLLACGATRSSRTNTPPPPAGPIQTASDSGNLLPAGTTLPIRINQNIQTQDAGGAYDAEVAQDVVSSDYDVVIPKGSSAELVVVRTDRGGAVGTPEIELALRSLTVRGKRYTVDSASSTQRGDEGLGRNERTATMVGGGAVLGTVIGAIAGGAQGAAIGAAVGAAGGAAGQVLTRGREVQVPAESILTFQVQQPIELSD